MCVGACSTVGDPSESSPPADACSVHRLELTSALVPVEHGSLNAGRIPGYEDARAGLFPNSVVPQRHGDVHELTLERHCVACTGAECEWVFAAFDGALSSDEAWLPTYYELPPRMPAPDTRDPGECDIHGMSREHVLSPVFYACSVFPIEGYEEARPRLFPDVVMPGEGQGQGITLVAHCPACTAAEREWIEERLGEVSFHPFYEVPPILHTESAWN